jgi:hypothetical protein
MFIEMTCGCMAAFQADAEDSDTLLLTWANSFVEAHRGCGYMASINKDNPEKTKHYDVNPLIKRKEKDE